MNVLIRVDAGARGMGHLSRCLVLADALRERGAACFFVCQSDIADHKKQILTQGFRVIEISIIPPIICQSRYSDDPRFHLEYEEKDAAATLEVVKALNVNINLVIVDHYSLGRRWEELVRKKCKKLLVIDDLANRSHTCDILVDQNFIDNYESRYDHLVSPSTVKLLGIEYLLLHADIRKKSVVSRVQKSKVKRILVFYGGSDPTNETDKFLCAFEQYASSGLVADVVVGSMNVDRHDLVEKCRLNKNVRFYVDIDYMHQLMVEADVAFGGGGVNMWERCFLGLPSFVTIIADNQANSVEAAASEGAVVNLGLASTVSSEVYANALEKILAANFLLQDINLSAKQMTSIVGKGASKIIDQLDTLL